MPGKRGLSGGIRNQSVAGKQPYAPHECELISATQLLELMARDSATRRVLSVDSWYQVGRSERLGGSSVDC